MHKLRNRMALGGIGLCVLFACTDETIEATADSAIEQGSMHLDVNDVGGVLGRDNDANMFPKIGVGSLAAASVFQDVTAFGKKIVSPGFASPHSIALSGAFANPENWQVSAWRFDPCATNRGDLQTHAGNTALGVLASAPSVTRANAEAGRKILDAETCDVQLRLIVQPVIDGADGDYTMHMIFDLGTGAANGVRDAAVRDLLALKQTSLLAGAQTTGVTLGVHPALSKGSNAFAQRFSAFIAKYATPKRLSAVAFMGVETFSSEPWTFYAGVTTQAATHWSAIGLPAFAGDNAGPAKGATMQTFRQTAPIGVFPKPPSSQVTTVALMDDREPDVDPAKEAAIRMQRATTANAVNNPDVVNFFTTDCVSCHTATQRMIGESLPSASAGKLYAVPKGVTAFVAGTEAQASSWNLRNLGYFLGAPSIAYRTAFESAQTVDVLNRFVVPFLGGGFVAGRNPGDDCSSAEVYACFVSEAQAVGNTGTCSKKCKTAAPIEIGPDDGGKLPTLATLETCKDRELAVRPNRESGNTPASLVATASKRFGLSLSVNDSTCMSRVFNGNFSTRAKADAPNQKGLPLFEFKCVTTRDCDAFFVFGAAPTSPAPVALSKADSTALSDLFKTQDRMFQTVNVGARLAGTSAAQIGLKVDCTNRNACMVSPVLN